MQELMSLLPDSVLLGFVYGLSAMGLTLIWRAMKVLNLAHGAVISTGMFGAYFSFTHIGINPYISLISIAILGFLLGVLIYFIAVHKYINAAPSLPLLSTFAINMIFIGLGTALFATDFYNADLALGRVNLGFITFSWTYLIAAAITLSVAGLFYLFLHKTYLGKHIRAAINNRNAAELMGISTTKMFALSFGLGTMSTAISGSLLATLSPFSILSGNEYALKSFVIGVISGLGNPIGALFSGLIIGTMEGIIFSFWDASWIPAIEFGLLVTIIVLRPSGIFGAKE